MSDVAHPQAIIHIGGPKTGSTYLQKRLRLNRTALEDSGIHLPYNAGFEKIAGNAKLLANLLMSTPCARFKRAIPAHKTQSLSPASVLAELLQHWNQKTHTLLLSAEILQHSHAAQLRMLLPASIRPGIVLFVRRQDAWLESYYNQLIKARDIVLTPDEFLKEILTNTNEQLYYPDWLLQYRAWKQAFGNCSVVYYEEAKSDLLTAFLHSAGLKSEITLQETEQTQTSLHPFQIRLLYDAGRGVTRWKHQHYLAYFRNSDESGVNTDRYTLFNSHLNDRILSQFKSSNRLLWSSVTQSRANHTDDPADRSARSPFDTIKESTAVPLNFSEIPSIADYRLYQARCDEHISQSLNRVSA